MKTKNDRIFKYCRFDHTHLSIFRVVHSHRGVALWGVVDVPVVPYGSEGLHGVSSHAGHGDRGQTVPGVKVKDVLVLAVQQQHHGLSERERGGGHNVRAARHREKSTMRQLTPVTHIHRQF